MAAYYNEFDPNAAAWLRQLIKQGLIADGDVDDRSIVNVRPEDIRGYEQCHFFAGIGGWSYALRLAGISDSEPIWTASLPCQPFSTAGKQLGKSDERHLLPHFIELVRQCRPNRIFGEQVPGAIRHGWLDDLYTEMERENYSVGSCVLTAAGAGAYHIRQRLYWMAYSKSERERSGKSRCYSKSWNFLEGSESRSDCQHNSKTDGLAYSKNQRRESIEDERCAGVFREMLQQEEPQPRLSNMGTTFSGMAYPMCSRQQGQRELGQSLHTAQSGNREVDRTINASNISNGDSDGRMGDTEHNGHVASTQQRSNESSIQNSAIRENSTSESAGASTPRAIPNEWSEPDWIYCRDNKYRPIKPCIKPLVNRVSERMVRSSDPSTQINADETQEARVMRLKGYGNAIVPQVAAVFIQAAFGTTNPS